jgi:hypothetical protein
MGTLPFKWLRVVGHNILGDTYEKDTVFLHYQLRLPMCYSRERPSGEQLRALCHTIGMASTVRVAMASLRTGGLRVPMIPVVFTNLITDLPSVGSMDLRMGGEVLAVVGFLSKVVK